MHYTIDMLIQGDGAVVAHYKRALEIWEEIIRLNEFAKVETLAKVLTSRQMQFEHECGGRWVGQEVMVVSGIARFYTTQIGFESNEAEVLRVYDAFMASFCSIEVKGHARDVAESYDLEGLRHHD
jgi:hypothetical protein